MSPKEGLYTSKRIERLHQKRHAKIKDLFHKASYHIVQIAIRENVSKVVVGINHGWKQQSEMSKTNNQKFCFNPHAMLIAQLRYKLAQVGIELVEQEESYTSKASFLSMDAIPVYDPTFVGEHEFSGYRKSRGIYKQKGCKTIINADVNGSANILRKAFPNAFANGIEGLASLITSIVSTPQPLNVR
jgi:putative transposase